jgi:hypothetical protein
MTKVYIYLVVMLCAVFLTVPSYAGPVIKRSSGQTSVHGINGTTGNEETLQFIYSMKDIPMWVSGPTYYFGDANATGDFAAGDDTNDCLSPDTACVNWWKALHLCPNANCILDAGDADWFTINKCVDANDGVAIPQVGGGGADGICDVDAVTPRVADGGYNGSTNMGGTGANPISTPWWNMRSSRPGTRVVITETDAVGEAIWHFNGGGTLILQDLEFTGFSTKVMMTESGVGSYGHDNYDGTRLLANNVSCNLTTGATDYCWQLKGSLAVILNSEGYSAVAPILVVSEDARGTWISTKTIEKTATTNVSPPIFMTSQGLDVTDCCPHLTMIGSTVKLSGNGGSEAHIFRMPPTHDNFFFKTRLARVHINGADATTDAGGCIVIGRTGGRYVDLELYQSTLSYCRIAFWDNNTSNVSNPLHRIIAKYNVFQNGTLEGTQYGAWLNQGGGYADGIISIRDNIVNEEGGGQANYFVVEDEGGVADTTTTVADMRTALLDESAAMRTTLADFFANDTVATDDDQFAGTCYQNLGTGGRSACICDRATPEDCATPIPNTYTIELLAPIPKEIFGSAEDLKYLTLGNVNTNYGAY